MAGILALITQGATLQFQSVATPSYYAVAGTTGSGQPVVLAGGLSNGDANFVATMYHYDPQTNQAKIALQSSQTNGYWAAGGESYGGLPYPLALYPDSGSQFVLTDTGAGISIRNAISPPPPYFRVLPLGIDTFYLGYNSPDAGNTGLFNISIVG